MNKRGDSNKACSWDFFSKRIKKNSLIIRDFRVPLFISILQVNIQGRMCTVFIVRPQNYFDLIVPSNKEKKRKNFGKLQRIIRLGYQFFCWPVLQKYHRQFKVYRGQVCLFVKYSMYDLHTIFGGNNSFGKLTLLLGKGF